MVISGQGSTEHYPVIPLSVTMATFQGHSNMRQLQIFKTVYSIYLITVIMIILVVQYLTDKGEHTHTVLYKFK